jgi:hypothetical protein
LPGPILCDAAVPLCPIRQILASLVAVYASLAPAIADPLTLLQNGKYDHDNEITVCLNADDAKKFYRNFKGANVYTTGCFPAKIGDFMPMYKVDNIQMITETQIYGFVYGISGSVTPRSGEILYDVPLYIVTPAIVVDQNQKEVLVADLY